MSETKLNLDLDPKSIIKSLNDIANESKKLSRTLEDSLGKESVKSVDKLEKASENGTAKIQSYFRNLGTGLKENLKTAFDFGKVMTGLKFGQMAQDGIKQVLDMEKAFARLNTRLQLSGSALQNFKASVGKNVSSTGQKLEDILPGVERATSAGNIKDPKQIQAIASMLAKTRAITGEDVSGVAEEAIDILKKQGSKINAANISKTIDAMQAARATGAFGTAGEAGGAMREIAPFASRLGINTRGAAGLTAVASQAGESGQNILRQIMEHGTTIGGQAQLNAVLGREIFKGGKLRPEEIGKVDVKRFGNQQIMEQAAGLTGATGQDLALFVDSFKHNMDKFKTVTTGANETAAQFDIAADNLGTDMDKFKNGLIESVRAIGDSLSSLGHDVLHGNFKKLGEDAKGVGSSLGNNAGTLLGGAALSVGVGALAGGGLQNLLGMGKGLATGKALKSAAGVDPVYVVNANEIGEASLNKVPGASAAGGVMGMLGKVAAVAGVAVTAYEGTKYLMENTALGEMTGKATEKIYDWMNPDQIKSGEKLNTEGINYDKMSESIVNGMVKGTQLTDKEKQIIYTRPNTMPPVGMKI